MYEVSDYWKGRAVDGVLYHIRVYFPDSGMELTDRNFVQGTVKFSESVSNGDEMFVGAAVTNTFSATVNNSDKQFKASDFANQKIEVYFWIDGDLDEDEEQIELKRGTYYLDPPEAMGTRIDLMGYDLTDKSNANLSSTDVEVLKRNAESKKEIFRFLANSIKLYAYDSIETLTFDGYTDPTFGSHFNITSNQTYKSIMSQMAAIMGKYMIAKGDKFHILNLEGGYAEAVPFSEEVSLNGGTFWAEGDSVSGGSFWDDDGNRYNGGMLIEMYRQLVHYNDCTVYLDPVEFTEVKVTDSKGTSARVGSSAGLGIVLEGNYVVQGYDEALHAAEWIHSYYQNKKFRPFTVSCIGNPAIEVGDRLLLINGGEAYSIVVAELNYTLNGFMKLSFPKGSKINQVSASENIIDRAYEKSTVLVDTVTGTNYRLKVTNGVIGLEEII